MMGPQQRMSLFVLLSLLFIAVPVLAQENACPEIVQAALNAASERCSSTGRNEACYGNVNLQAVPQSGVDNFTFSAPGDIVAVSDIEQLTLSSRVEEAGEWGVALLQLQASLPDSVPGQNVMFVLFGDVEITNAVESGDSLNPMQAFYFDSGIGDAPCAEAPDSGILVQTPTGAAQIEFTVNGVDISLGSTAYLQAQPNGQMMTSVIEGTATLTSQGESVIVPAGSQVHVLLDEEGLAAEIPSQPQPYDLAQMEVLPIQLLPRAITIAAPSGSGEGIVLNEGEWTWTPGTPSDEGCEAGVMEFVLDDFTPNGPFLLPGGEFDWPTFYEAAYGEMPAQAVVSNPAPNIYVMDTPLPQFSWHYEVRVIDSTHIEGEFSSSAEDCAIVIPFQMTWGSAVDNIVPTPGEWDAVWVPPSISCDNFTGGNLTWNMSFYNSFRLPEGEFSPSLLYESILGFDLSDQVVNSSGPEPNHYVMDSSEPFGELHFEVQVIDSDHIEGNYQLINRDCVFDFSFQMTRVGD